MTFGLPDRYLNQNIEREVNRRKILRLLQSGNKRFNEIQKQTGIKSTKTVAKHLTDLEGEGNIGYVKSRKEYTITQQGVKYTGMLWMILHNLLEMKKLEEESITIDKKPLYHYTHFGSYSGLPVKSLIPASPIGDIGFSIDKLYDDNTNFKMLPQESEIVEFFLRKLVENSFNNKINFKEKDGKIIIALEIETLNFYKFLNKIQKFMDSIINERDIFSDKEFGLDYGFTIRDIDTLEDYLQYSLMFNNTEFNEKLPNYLEAIVNYFKTNKYLEPEVLDVFIRDVKADKDPLDNPKIKNKLIYKKLLSIDGKRKVVGVDLLFNYINATKLLHYSDKSLVDKLTKYRFEQEVMIDKSKSHKIISDLQRKHHLPFFVIHL